jgi:hypothetical protein
VGTTAALLWVKDGDYRYDAPARVDVPDGRVALDDLPGRWCGAWWDTWAGHWHALVQTVGGPGHDLAVPPFTGDTALRVNRC